MQRVATSHGGLFQQLPNRLQLAIFAFFDAYDVPELGLVSKSSRGLVESFFTGLREFNLAATLDRAFAGAAFTLVARFSRSLRRLVGWPSFPVSKLAQELGKPKLQDNVIEWLLLRNAETLLEAPAHLQMDSHQLLSALGKCIQLQHTSRLWVSAATDWQTIYLDIVRFVRHRPHLFLRL